MFFDVFFDKIRETNTWSDILGIEIATGKVVTWLQAEKEAICDRDWQMDRARIHRNHMKWREIPSSFKLAMTFSGSDSFGHELPRRGILLRPTERKWSAWKLTSMQSQKGASWKQS